MARVTRASSEAVDHGPGLPDRLLIVPRVPEALEPPAVGLACLLCHTLRRRHLRHVSHLSRPLCQLCHALRRGSLSNPWQPLIPRTACFVPLFASTQPEAAVAFWRLSTPAAGSL